MPRQLDNQHIQASVWTFLETLCAAAPAVKVHWPDTGEQDLSHEAWIEPWLDIANRVGRKEDWLYDFRLLINVFSKPTGLSMYVIPAILGKLCGGIKAQIFEIQSYGLTPPAHIGEGRFLEPESTDLGRTRTAFTASLLRHAVIRCDGLVMPLGT